MDAIYVDGSQSDETRTRCSNGDGGGTYDLLGCGTLMYAR